MIRHYTSRAGDPHRHLHLQVNARVWAAGAWRGLHSVGVGDIDRGDQRDRARRGRDRPASSGRSSPRTASPWTPRPARSRQLAPYVGCVQRPDRTDPPQHRPVRSRSGAASTPARSPGRGCARRGTGGRGPKPGPTRSSRRTARELVARWNDELRELGYRDPAAAVPLTATRSGWVDRDAAADLVALPASGRSGRPGTPPTSAARSRSSLAQTDLVADPAARIELAEDITARAVAPVRPLLDRDRRARARPVPDLPAGARGRGRPRRPARAPCGAAGPQGPHRRAWSGRGSTRPRPRSSAPWPATGQLVVVEGAAGAGKTTALRVGPRAAARAGASAGGGDTDAEGGPGRRRGDRRRSGHSAAWLIHQHGWRWDDDGHWTRQPDPAPGPARTAAAR